MKLKKAEMAVICVTAVAIIFTGGYLVGRSGAKSTISTQPGISLVRPEFEVRSSGTVDSAESDEREIININTADLETLTRLPGIGQVLAGRIIEHREENGDFADITDIMDVSGIGTSVYEKIKDSITVEG